MSSRDESVLYIKYSNERNREFSIRTEILEDSQGKLSVLKVPLYKEGMAYVAGLEKKYDRLRRDYEKIGLCCNRGTKEKDGFRLEYVCGKSLEEYLDTLLEQKKTAEAEKILKSYIKKIYELPEQKEFFITDDFKSVFGNIEGLEGLRSVTTANIDMLCQNVIINGSIWTLIDYEWTFFFPIPINFIVYRVLHYYLEVSAKRRAHFKDDFYVWAGITKELKNSFIRMESNFQYYLTSSHTPMREMYGAISPGVYPVKHLVSNEQIRRNQERMQVFFSDNNGFREIRSVCFTLLNGEFRGTIEIPDGTDEIRLDPCDGMGMCRIVELSYDEGEVEKIVPSEGIVGDGEYYLINTADPQFYLGKVPKGAKSLKIKLFVVLTSADAVEVNKTAKRIFDDKENRVQELVEKQQKLELQLADQMKEIINMRDEIEMRDMQIKQMEQTKVWKIYKKYCNIRERK